MKLSKVKTTNKIVKKNTKKTKMCNCGCPKSLRLKAKLRKQQQKEKSQKTIKNTKNNKTQVKRKENRSKKSHKRVQRGGSNCELGLGTERGFKVAGESGLNGLNIPSGKFLLTPKPGCMNSNHAGL